MPTFLLFITCLLFWLVLSGHAGGLDLAAGLVASGLVAFHNRDRRELADAVRAFPRLLGYVPWLLRQIVAANLQVARIVLHPALPIDPVLVRCHAALKTPLARTTLGNSITLTPGTLTLDLEEDTVLFHALTPDSARSVTDGDLVDRVARTFGEDRA